MGRSPARIARRSSYFFSCGIHAASRKKTRVVEIVTRWNSRWAILVELRFCFLQRKYRANFPENRKARGKTPKPITCEEPEKTFAALVTEFPQRTSNPLHSYGAIYRYSFPPRHRPVRIVAFIQNGTARFINWCPFFR